MTTGTFAYDHRQPVNVTYGGKIGPAGKRVWTGTDSPAKPAKRYEVLIPRYESHILGPNGKPIVIPEYRKRVNTPIVVKQRGEHNYSATIEHSRGVIYKYLGAPYGFGNTSLTQNYPAQEVPAMGDQAWSSNDEAVLINRLRKAMMGSDFDPAIFLATSSQSLHMIAQTALRMRRSLNLIQRGRLREASRVLVRGSKGSAKAHRDFSPKGLTKEDLASAQLELSYGWLPLLSDAYNGAEYLCHNTQLPQKQSFLVRYRRPFTQRPASYPTWTYPVQKCFARGQLIARMNEDFAFSAQYLMGFDDPLSMAWERLPWSFVADWFIPVQNYLTARQFARQVKGTFIKTTSWKKTIQGCKGSGLYIRQDPDTFYYQGVGIVRTVSSTLAVPYPKLKSLSSVPSWRRALNAVSLLTVRFGS